MRRRYIVTNDISHPRRLKRTFKVLRDYGSHLQYSVFECLLNEMERIRLEDELKDEIHQKEDQVLFFDLGPAESESSMPVRSLGIPYRPRTIRAEII